LCACAVKYPDYIVLPVADIVVVCAVVVEAEKAAVRVIEIVEPFNIAPRARLEKEEPEQVRLG
jgi:hypothetical protein